MLPIRIGAVLLLLAAGFAPPAYAFDDDDCCIGASPASTYGTSAYYSSTVSSGAMTVANVAPSTVLVSPATSYPTYSAATFAPSASLTPVFTTVASTPFVGPPSFAGFAPSVMTTPLVATTVPVTSLQVVPAFNNGVASSPLLSPSAYAKRTAARARAAEATAKAEAAVATAEVLAVEATIAAEFAGSGHFERLSEIDRLQEDAAVRLTRLENRLRAWFPGESDTPDPGVAPAPPGDFDRNRTLRQLAEIGKLTLTADERAQTAQVAEAYRTAAEEIGENQDAFVGANDWYNILLPSLGPRLSAVLGTPDRRSEGWVGLLGQFHTKLNDSPPESRSELKRSLTEIAEGLSPTPAAGTAAGDLPPI